MGKLYDRLQKQLKYEEYKKDAEDCLEIYENIKEINDGKVWSSVWIPLTECKLIDSFPYETYRPSQEGYVFLKGIEKKTEREDGVQYISVQTAIIRHLSDVQEMNSVGMGEYGYNHINFAKQLVLTYPDTSIEVSEKELNELWKKTIC